MEAVNDLKQRLQSLGSELIIRHGKPETVIPAMAAQLGASRVYAQKETCSEEILVERNLQAALQKLPAVLPQSNTSTSSASSSKTTEIVYSRAEKPRLELLWGATMYHLDDLPFSANQLPDIYTQFRKSVESRSKVRDPLEMPQNLGPFPEPIVEKIGGKGELPSMADLGLQPQQQDPRSVMRMIGGETAALDRLNDYFWTKNLLRVYKETRNGMLGSDYSTKFSPWLAAGCISPRHIHAEVKRYEKEREANESTYWVLFELIWRDYFRFLSIKCGNSIFFLGGPRNVPDKQAWSQNQPLFDSWRTGTTGYPLVDANMRELEASGFMSNRGRQIVCSFLVRDLGLDWRLGAEWFESLLLDYDPASNYGNWTYGAGVGNDPREDRYFSIPKQAQTYDPQGDYVAHWIPELQKLPPKSRHFPGSLSPSERALYGWNLQGGYPRPIVPLKHGSSGGGFSGGGRGGGGGGRGGGSRNTSNKGRGRSGQSARF